MRARQILWTAAVGLSLTAALPRLAAAQPQPSIADQPAATLLLPYFEVDLAHPAGANTIFSINNASNTAVLAHVTVWSQMQVPVYAFDVYLTGYDAQQINVRDILSGVLPQTASAAQDPGNLISPQGPLSQDITFGSCAGLLPAPSVPQATVTHIRNSLTGVGSAMAGGMCASISDGTQVARGYITVDTVNNCTSRLPNEPGYFFSGGVGDASNQNVLWGDYTSTNHIGGFDASDGAPLVHIRANATDPETSTPGEYTFYGRLVAWTAADNREPLGGKFMLKYASLSASAVTSVTVWRDAKVNQNYFSCASRPSWFPLSQTEIVMFDEQEQIMETGTSSPYSPPPPESGAIPFPMATQRVVVGTGELPSIFQFGILYLNLNTFVTGSPNPPEDPQAAQAWVEVRQKGTGRYSSGWSATMLSSSKEETHGLIRCCD